MEQRQLRINQFVRPLFYVAGLYDGLLGLLFIVQPLLLYRVFDVTPPNHLAYVQFPAALLIIFAIMFFAIARQPMENRNLILFGVLLKIAFCGVAFSHWIMEGIPAMWKPFAVADLIFLVLFVVAWRQLSSDTSAQ